MAQELYTTPKGTLLYTHVFKPATAMDGGEGKFEITVALPPEALKTAEYAALKKAVDEKIDSYAKELKVKPAALRSPLRDNDERHEKYPDTYLEGGVFFSAKSKFKPAVVDGGKRPITDEEAVWMGQEGRVRVSVYGYNISGNKGVGLGLSAVQVTDANKERIGGGDGAAGFDEVEDNGSPF